MRACVEGSETEMKLTHSHRSLKVASLVTHSLQTARSGNFSPGISLFSRYISLSLSHLFLLSFLTNFWYSHYEPVPALLSTSHSHILSLSLRAGSTSKPLQDVHSYLNQKDSLSYQSIINKTTRRERERKNRPSSSSSSSYSCCSYESLPLLPS